jgi:internalin A
MTKLERLYLAWCTALWDVSGLADLSKLEWLDLSGCEALTDVSVLAGLTKLEWLNLAGCKALRDVSGLADLTQLEWLNLSGCKALRGSFAPLGNLLKTLKHLSLYRTNFDDPPSELCGESPDANVLEAVRAYYYALDCSGPCHDAGVKVFVLGNGGVGKTQLCRRLRGKPFEKNWNSTQGIEIRNINDRLSDSETTVRLNLWDFGGQDIYYGTHHHFLHPHAVFILLWTPETEQGEYEEEYGEAGVKMRQKYCHRPLSYWRDYLHSLAGYEIPVLLVQGKCDNGKQEALPIDLPKKWVRLEFSACVDPGEEKLTALREELRRAAGRVLEQHPQAKLPNNWVLLAQALRDLVPSAAAKPGIERRRTLSRKRFRKLYREICEKNGPSDKCYWQEVLQFLHRRGVVYWRPDLFRGRIVLDQSWALNGIYALFNAARREAGVFPEGRFTLGQLAISIWQKHTPKERQTFLSMMESCGICFRARRLNPGAYPEKWQYIAPELLPEYDAAAVQNQLTGPLRPGQVTARAEAHYIFLHEGVLRRFLSWLGTYVENRAVYWKYGCRFYDPDTDVHVLIDTKPDDWKNGQRGAITLLAWGARSVQWLEPCLTALKRISPIQQPTTAAVSFNGQEFSQDLADAKIPDVVQFFRARHDEVKDMLLAAALIGDVLEESGKRVFVQGDLANRLGVTPAEMSKLLDRMETEFTRYFKHQGLPREDLFARGRGARPVIFPQGKKACEAAMVYRNYLEGGRNA